MDTIAAIDIGSNAIRLVIGEIDEHQDIRVLEKIREPVRLGKDVFSTGHISEKTLDKAIAAFSKFRQLLSEHSVHQIKAVATSALREAANRDEFVTAVNQAAGIRIDVIDGLEEARLIHSAVAHRVDLEDKSALLIDIGGGSVELTHSISGQVSRTQTFKLGTVRLLQILEEHKLKESHLRQYLSEHMDDVQAFIKAATKTAPIDFCIGTGGNFECLGKLRVALLHRNSIFTMHTDELGELIDRLQNLSLKDRIQTLRLRPDRADVVVPAALVAQAVMKFIPADLLLIPNVGLRDGILADIGLSRAPAQTQTQRV